MGLDVASYLASQRKSLQGGNAVAIEGNVGEGEIDDYNILIADQSILVVMLRTPSIARERAEKKIKRTLTTLLSSHGRCRGG
jgi:hypothetical protein